MTRMWRFSLAALLVMAAAVVPARAQVAVVTIKSVDEVLADVKYVLTLAGQEGQARQLDGMIAAATQGKKGIDGKRPLGVVVGDVKKGEMPNALIFVPVTKEDEFLELLKGFGIEPSKPEKGIYTVDTPLGQSLYLRFANNYVYAADSADKLEGKLPDPAMIIPAANKASLLAVTVNFAKIPEDSKKELLEQIDAQIAAEKEKKDGESDEQYQARIAGTKFAREAVGMILEQGQTGTFSFDVDRKSGNFVLDAGVVAKSGTKLATRIRDFGPAGATAPVHFEVSLGKVAMLFLPEGDDGKIGELRKVLGKSGQTDDKLKITLAGGESLNFRIEVSGKLVKLAAVMAPKDGGD